jgi:hypothetical protein
MSDKTKTKFKYKVLSSFLLTEEKKAELLAKLDSLSDTQIAEMQEAIEQAEAEGLKFLSENLPPEKWEALFSQMGQENIKFKKDVLKQEEKEDRSKEKGNLESTLEELNDI